MDFLMEHWLSVGTAVFLLAMILRGHYRGFLKIAVSMSALVLSLVIVRLATPYVTNFMKENTAVQHVMEQGLLKMAGVELDSAAEQEEIQYPAGSGSSLIICGYRNR